MPSKHYGSWLFAAVLLSFVACQSLHREPDVMPEDGHANLRAEPTVTHTHTVHAVACDLDHLEKHIDWYGSVVAKSPDVWGQARLTVYREQFEEQMKDDLTKFKESLQGTTARSDQAFAQSATALGMALSVKYATKVLPPGNFSTVTDALTGTKPVVVTQPTQVVVTPPAAPAILLPGVSSTTTNGATTTTVTEAPFLTPSTTFNAAKFVQHDELREILLGTGDAKLVERTANDSYWGDGGDGSGKNRLGQILMHVREELRLAAEKT